MLRVSILSALLALCAADCYMHMPRGSNNRLNEASANRNNGNRCFDSQNNNRGGYNVCDLGTNNGFPNTANTYFALYGEAYTQGFFTGDRDGSPYYETSDTVTSVTGNPGQSPGSPKQATDYNKQTERFYFEESYMAVTWTMQHGTGGNLKVYTQVIAQYMVENMQNSPTMARFGNNGNTQPARANPTINSDNTVLRGSATNAPGAPLTTAAQNTRYDLMRRLGLRVMLANGRNTNTPTATSSTSMTDLNAQFQDNTNPNNGGGRCQHESNEWYSLCRNRDRNKGLFTADQNVNEDRATHTRQNPNGNRRGLECPEERDYYPYWYPSPFVDVAILTGDVADCNTNMKPESQNTKLKYACTNQAGYAIPTDAAILDAFNQTQCTAAGGQWMGFSWNMPAPECLKLPHSQVNHLGNMVTGSISGQSAGGSQSYFMWKLPKYSDLVDKTKVMGQPHEYRALKMRTVAGAAATTGTNNMMSARCVRMLFRLRYNMSSTDYDPYMTNATHNDKPNSGIISPIKQNPTVEMGVLNQGLRLAINTAQTGRTFQDRSHTFLVCQRSSVSGLLANKEILNLQVQGKRGNIVQTFPATEYQFSPRQWTFCPGTMFHFQWSGSNTHNNGNPAGDGQAGDAGEGQGGTDRHNMMQMLNMQGSYPAAYDTIAQTPDNFWNYVTCYAATSMDRYTNAEDAAIAAATSGYYHSRAYATEMYKVIRQANPNQNAADERLQETFNNMSASYRSGIICEAKATLPAGRHFAFLCTRNNNFTNRAQKMKVLTAATCGFAQNQTPIDAIGSVNPLMALG